MARESDGDLMKSSVAVPVSSSDVFDSFIEAIDQVEYRLTELSITTEIPDRDRSWVLHILNLVQGISSLLSEDFAVGNETGSGGDHSGQYRFGQMVRAYDLDFFRDASLRVVEELNVRPSSTGPMLVVLVPYLQLWVDFVIPSALGDLDSLNTDREVTPSVALESRLRNYEQLRRISNLEREAVQTVQNLKQAANEGGKERLAQTFEARGEAEAVSAQNWNRLVMLFVALGIGLPLGAIAAQDHFLGQLTGTYGVVVKGLIGLPLFALATYCGRISALHRKTSQHMKTLTTQIDSVRAYVETLPPATQQEIIAGLGRRAFSEPGLPAVDGSVGIPPEQILPTLDRAIEALKQVRN